MKRKPVRNTILLASIVTVMLVLSSCSAGDELSGPDPADPLYGAESGAVENEKKDCPTFAEACDVLGKAVYEACPEKIGADDGDIALCKFYAFIEIYKQFSRCFNAAEFQELYDCAKRWVPTKDPIPTTTGGGKRIPTPAAGPRPPGKKTRLSD